MTVRSYRDLRVWQRAMDLVVLCYEASKKVPHDERYGLVSQLRRAAVSVPSNVAEGHCREHLGEYLHHLSIANGSLMELETGFLITQRLGYLPDETVREVFSNTREVGRMLATLIRKLKAKPRPPTPDTRHLTPDT
ncbi:MAG TPA: four helix bundle protein [Gemmatimonadales bacterium]|nr:four helix bundle protein [Gemmatimonadales bacterium]